MARAWYARDPVEVRACPAMFAGDAIQIYAAGLARGRAAEREVTVKWFRLQALALREVGDQVGEFGATVEADAIERGDHMSAQAVDLEDT